MGYSLLINGVHSGYNPLILTFHQAPLMDYKPTYKLVANFHGHPSRRSMDGISHIKIQWEFEIGIHGTGIFTVRHLPVAHAAMFDLM